MGILGISLSETKYYISQFDTVEPKTIFKLGVLDAEVFASLGEFVNNPLRMMLEIARFGIKGFENLKDGAGNVIKYTTISRNIGPYNYKVVADSTLKIIPSQVISELGAEILRMSKLSEEETKNS